MPVRFPGVPGPGEAEKGPKTGKNYFFEGAPKFENFGFYGGMVTPYRAGLIQK